MAGTWKTVRVFISSTFRDMHSERDWLVKRVFPSLRERLEKHRVNLVDIDLRWGVTEQQAENGGALEVCLDQIDDCRPFFLGLLGERYGWVPRDLPERITSKYGWSQHLMKKSITELEILYGVLNDPEMHDYSFFCFRDAKILRELPEIQLRNWGEFPTNDERRTLLRRDARTHAIDRRRKLRALKQAISDAKLPTPPLEYACRYAGMKINWRLAKLELSDADRQALEAVARDGLVDPREYADLNPHLQDLVHRFGTVQLEGLQEFGNRIQDWLWESIRRRLNLPEQPPIAAIAATDLLAEEQDYHERFMEPRLRVYVGRKDVRNDLASYADGDDKFPCLVTGGSGSGKSAALARFVHVYKRVRRSTLVISHFIGASPRSTNLRDMLWRFCQIFKARFGFAEDVPEEAAELSLTFREFVGRIPTDTRVLLVIDALNQLDEADRAQELYWLPREFPPQVKVIVSCITDSGESEPVLGDFRSRKYYQVQLAALSEAEERLIIRKVPSLSAKTLGDDQVRLLLSNPATANPLFLLVALEELRGFGSYEQLNERIATFPRAGNTVTAIFTQVIERLEDEFHRHVVHDVLSLLASARRGLSERELLDLIEATEVDIGQSQSDLFPVLRQLRPYLQPRAELIDYYHRGLFKAVQERYLKEPKHRRTGHLRLADYFERQDWWRKSPGKAISASDSTSSRRVGNVRKADELPWQVTVSTSKLIAVHPAISEQLG